MTERFSGILYRFKMRPKLIVMTHSPYLISFIDFNNQGYIRHNEIYVIVFDCFE